MTARPAARRGAPARADGPAAELCTANGNSYAAAAGTGWAPRAASIAVRASPAFWWATQIRTAAARLPLARCAPATP